MRVRGHMLEHRWAGRNKRLSEPVAIKGKGKEFNQFLHTHKHYNSLVNILRLSRWTTSAMEAEKKRTHDDDEDEAKENELKLHEKKYTFTT